MKVIQIKAKDFFEFIKLKDTSMWEIFSQMIDGEEKEIIFLDEEEKILFYSDQAFMNFLLKDSQQQKTALSEKGLFKVKPMISMHVSQAATMAIPGFLHQ